MRRVRALTGYNVFVRIVLFISRGMKDTATGDDVEVALARMEKNALGEDVEIALREC